MAAQASRPRWSFTCPFWLAGAWLAACGDDPPETAGPTASLPTTVVATDPAEGAQAVPVTAWIVFELAEPVADLDPAQLDLACGGQPIPLTWSPVGDGRWVVNPSGELAPSASCQLAWEDAQGPRTLTFATAASDPVAVPYDRTDRALVSPFPDDYFLVPDDGTPTGYRVEQPVPAGLSGRGLETAEAIVAAAGQPDGFSPIGFFFVAVPEALDPASLPLTADEDQHGDADRTAAMGGSRPPWAPSGEADSLDPLASVGLFDLDPESPSYGERVPFQLWVRDDVDWDDDQTLYHALLVWPSIPLRTTGRYALVVTRRARVAPDRTLAPSSFLQQALAAPVDGEPPEVTRAREPLDEVVGFLQQHATPAIPPDDLALALRITVRSSQESIDDMLAIAEQIAAGEAPEANIIEVTPVMSPGHEVAAIVRGQWEVAIWEEDGLLTRDEAGRPVSRSTEVIEFHLALPRAALDGPVPIVIDQHGHPGSSAFEVTFFAETWLAASGLAVIGFTDRDNRRGGGQWAADYILRNLVQSGNVRAAFRQQWAEQLAFIRLVRGLGDLDLLPVDSPDGEPELAAAAPLGYLGISAGAINGTGLVALTSEIHAAALVVGGGRHVGVELHQSLDYYVSTVSLRPGATPLHTFWGFVMAAMAWDAEDPLTYAAGLREAPLPLPDGSTQRASVLLIEGLGDSFIPTVTTRATAWALGPLPHLQPVAEPVPYLESTAGPVQGNLGLSSGAFLQIAPAGSAHAEPAPSCVYVKYFEGHHCAVHLEAGRQVAAFLRSAVDDELPVIDSPDALCVPDCAGRTCGEDGCGLQCGDGACGAGVACSQDQTTCLSTDFLGNDTCDDALVIDEIPYFSAGTNEGAADDYTPTPGACPDYALLAAPAGTPQVGGRDVVYAYTPDADGRIEARLRPVPNPESCAANNEGRARPCETWPCAEFCNPMLLYVVTDCNQVATSCLGQNDNLYGVTVEATAGLPLYIIVDGFWATEVGAYELVVEPVP